MVDSLEISLGQVRDIELIRVLETDQRNSGAVEIVLAGHQGLLAQRDHMIQRTWIGNGQAFQQVLVSENLGKRNEDRESGSEQVACRARR